MRFGIRRALFTLGLSAGLLSTVGCPFFVCQKASCPTTGTTTGTGDYVYVSNSTTGSYYINGYQIGTSSLTPTTGSPYLLSVIPVAMAVSSNDDFLYVAGQGSTGLYVYSLNTSTGVVSGGTPIPLLPNSPYIDTMTVSPDGYFLYTVGQNSSQSEEVLTEYSLNTSNGGITTGSTGSSFPLATGAPCGLVSTTATQLCSVAVSPSEDYIAVSLGTAGTLIFPYTSSSTGGIPQNYTNGTIQPPSSGNYSTAFDTNGYLYVTTTTGISTFTSLGSSTPSVVVNGATLPAGGAPFRAVTLNSSGSYLFVADQGSNYISSFSVSSGVLTNLVAAPQLGELGPTGVSSLLVDRSGTYLLAGGSAAFSGLQMFTFNSTGITEVAQEGTEALNSSSPVPTVMALTH